MDTFCEDFTNLFGEELDMQLLHKTKDGHSMNFDFNFPSDTLMDCERLETKEQIPAAVTAQTLKGKFAPLEKKKPSANNRSTPVTSITSERLRRKTTPSRARASTQPVTESVKEARWKSWAHEEEVFLVGAVMDRFFRRGSLSSTRGSEDTGADDCWAFIKASYDKGWEAYTMRTGEKRPTDRSVAALSRHYKVMKARISAADLQGDTSIESFREYYNEFETMYSANSVTHRNSIHSCMGSVDSPRNNTVDRIDRRKRKVRLSFNSLSRFETTNSRRDSCRSTASCGTLDSTTSSSGSFFDEGGFVIKEEEKFDENEIYE